MVIADVAFCAVSVAALIFVWNDGLGLVRFIVAAALVVLADLGAWDVERAALKVRALFGGLGLLFGTLAMFTAFVERRLSVTEVLDQEFSRFILCVALLAISVASIVVCLLALRAMQMSRPTAAAAP
jgi:hypothetical protein